MINEPAFIRHDEKAKLRIADTIAGMNNKEIKLPDGYVPLAKFMAANGVTATDKMTFYSGAKTRPHLRKFKGKLYAPKSLLDDFIERPREYFSKNEGLKNLR